MKLTLRQLRYFSRIVEAGSITGAAQVLNLAPTALSVQVKTMEDRLGVKLLHRHSRGVRPTDQGHTLYESGREILALVRETECRVSTGRPTRQVVEMGILPSMVRLLGLDFLHAAVQQTPSVDLRLYEIASRSQIAHLKAGELHFALARGLRPQPKLRQIGVLEEYLVYVTAPQEARHEGRVELRDILSGDLAFYREGDSVWRAVHAAAAAAHLTVPSADVIGSVFMLREMVAKRQTSAIVPFGLVEKDAKAGALVVHQIVDHPVRQQIYLAWHADREDRLPTAEAIASTTALAAELGRRFGGFMRASGIE